MCTVTLSYNQNDIHARQALLALLGTGLFTQLDLVEEEETIDEAPYNDDPAFNAYMQEARQRIPGRKMSLEEAYEVVMEEVRSIYNMKDAV